MNENAILVQIYCCDPVASSVTVGVQMTNSVFEYVSSVKPSVSLPLTYDG